MSNNYSQKRLDSAKKSTTDAIKTDSKKSIKKAAEATGDLTGNKIADKITKTSNELHSKTSQNALKIDENEIEIPR